MKATAEDQFRFINLLALELSNGDISLPSLPDVVTKVRKLLESDECDFDNVSSAVSVDPVLVSKLFLYANSALYNRAGVTIDTLEGAIGRLGFEVVRNAAMSIAMEQLYSSEKHSHGKKFLQKAWARGMHLSCMGWSVARCTRKSNDEAAYLAGLMHDVGTLYLITKMDDFPELLGNEEAFNEIAKDWNPQIAKSIIESWGFNEEMAESADHGSYMSDENGADEPKLVDVMFVAELLVDTPETEEIDYEDYAACRRLTISPEKAAQIRETYAAKLKTMQASIG